MIILRCRPEIHYYHVIICYMLLLNGAPRNFDRDCRCYVECINFAARFLIASYHLSTYYTFGQASLS